MLPILDRFLLLRFRIPDGLLVAALPVVPFGAPSLKPDGLLFGLLLITMTAGLVVYGDLVRSSEILAMRASGASLLRIVRAPMLIALLVTIGFIVLAHIVTDSLGWWRIVAEAAAVPIAMMLALPLAVITARKNDMWVVATLGAVGYGCVSIVAVGLQTTGVVDTIRAPWLGDVLLAVTASVLFRRATLTR